MFDCYQVMLQVTTYITVVEIIKIEVDSTCITIFDLKVATKEKMENEGLRGCGCRKMRV